VNQELGARIVNRIVCLLINEAIDACFLNIASEKDIDLAMTKGVNYPKGLLTWANEKGLTNVLAELEELFYTYGEDRYRPSPLLKKMENENLEFFS
jgi:3-hydroxybutyryl-CoA dehydrogenase